MSANVKWIDLRDKIHTYSMFCEVNNSSHIIFLDFLLLVKRKAVVNKVNHILNVIVLQYVLIVHTRLQ